MRRWLTLVWLLMALVGGGCVSPGARSPTPVAFPSPGRGDDITTPARGVPGAPSPSPAATSSAAAAAPTANPGNWSALTWDHHPSLNQAHALAFDDAGALLSGSVAGVVSWNLDTGTPTLLRDGFCDGAPCAPQLVHDFALSPPSVGESALWVATSDGVRRYQAGSWTVFTQADGLPSTAAYTVVAAPDGTVWAGTDGGLASYDGRRWTPLASPQLGFGAPIWAVDVASDGTLWASTHGLGVLRYDPATGASQLYGTDAGFAYPNARELAVDAAGMPWVHIGYDQVYRFDGNRWQAMYASGGGEWVCDIAFDVSGGIPGWPFIGTCDGYHAYGGGLVTGQAGDWQKLSTEAGLPANSVTAVAIGPAGEVAVATPVGLAVRRGEIWQTLRSGPTLSDVRAVAVTPEGEVWFGFGDSAFYASGGGLAVFDGQAWSYVDPLAYGAGSNVRVLEIGPDGALWAGAGCSVARWDRGSWELLVPCDEIGNNVIAIVPLGDRSAVFATATAVCELDPRGVRCQEDKVPLAVAVDVEGDVWVAQSPLVGGGLVRFDGTRWLTETQPLAVVTALAVTPDGQIIAAGGGQAMRRDGVGVWRPLGEPEDGILALYVAGDGTIWGTADRRIVRLAGDRWETVLDAGDLVIHTFAITGGDLWLGTSIGAVRVAIPRER